MPSDFTSSPLSSAGNTRKTTTPTAHRIFSIPEMVEEIFSHLPLKDVFTKCIRVNHTFHACGTSYFTIDQHFPDLIAPAAGSSRHYCLALFKFIYPIGSSGLVGYVPIDGLPPFTFMTLPSMGVHWPPTQFYHITIASQKEALALRHRARSESWQNFDTTTDFDAMELSVTFRCIATEDLNTITPAVGEFKRGIDGKKGDTKWVTVKIQTVSCYLGRHFQSASTAVLTCPKAWTGVEHGEDFGLEVEDAKIKADIKKINRQVEESIARGDEPYDPTAHEDEDRIRSRARYALGRRGLNPPSS